MPRRFLEVGNGEGTRRSTVVDGKISHRPHREQGSGTNAMKLQLEQSSRKEDAPAVCEQFYRFVGRLRRESDANPATHQ